LKLSCPLTKTEPVMAGRKALLVLPLAAALVMLSCVSTGEAADPEGAGAALLTEKEKIALPEWFYTPPREEGVIFGIGTAENLSDARQMALVSVGQQFGVSLRSALETRSSTGQDGSAVHQVTEQLSDQRVQGAKFVDQFVDSQGSHWVLARAPINCLLDVTEAVLLSYRLDLTMEMEELVAAVDSVEEVLSDQEEWPPVIRESLSRKDLSALYIPRKAPIKIDGRIKDWEGVPPFMVLRDRDYSPSLPGTAADRLYLAVDDRYVYWLLTLRDGKPDVNNDVCYEVSIAFMGESWPVHIGLKLGTGYSHTPLHIHMPVGPADKPDGKQYNDAWQGRGTPRDFRVGDGFIEARFPLSSLFRHIEPDTVYMTKIGIYPEREENWSRHWDARWGYSSLRQEIKFVR